MSGKLNAMNGVFSHYIELLLRHILGSSVHNTLPILSIEHIHQLRR